MQVLLSDKQRFIEAVKTASSSNNVGLHGSVGTQNEKIIHQSLKHFYAPYSDEQEIKIGNYFADAVNENGIFEIQTQGLFRLIDKLSAFLPYSAVTVVHPVIRKSKTMYINECSGEITKETPVRNMKSNLDVFSELYSLRKFIGNENLRIILAELAVEKRVYYSSESIPDIRKKNLRKKCRIVKYPVELLGEIVLERNSDYRIFLPENLPCQFTKKELCSIVGESRSSLRTEILREAGIIYKITKNKNEFIYKVSDR